MGHGGVGDYDTHRCKEAGVLKETLQSACCNRVLLHKCGVGPPILDRRGVVLLLLHLLFNALPPSSAG